MDFPAAPASAGFATGNGIVLACCSGPAVACAVRRALERECPTPQECAIAGPALYPMKAPATAPTGPSTTAPDSAPKAALPARSCAFASTEKNVAAIAAATSSFFIAVPLDAPQGQGNGKNAAAGRSHDGSRRSYSRRGLQGGHSKSPRPVSRRGLSNLLRRWRYAGDLPDVSTPLGVL